ncbi:MAG: hypothetical protein S0880_26455, partial [Actinomycetota bacterium]|nr:hypothetical protein [Actinomycetota bacterium]
GAGGARPTRPAAASPVGLAVPAGIAALAAVVSLVVPPTPATATAEAPGTAEDRRRLRLALAAIVTGALGLAMMRVGAADLVFIRPRSASTYALVAAGALLVASAGWRADGIRRVAGLVCRWTAGQDRRRGIALAALAAVSWPPALLMADPDVALGAAAAIGSIAVVGLFLVALLTLVLALRWAADAAAAHPRTGPYALAPAFAALGFRRLPLPAVIGVWLVLTPMIPDAERYDVRQLGAGTASAQALETTTLATAVDRWVARQDLAPGVAVPAVAVAASGGGIRAGYWTAAVLDCAVEGETLGDDPCAARGEPSAVARRRDRLALLSGVSGGAVGITAYNAEVGPGWSTGTGVVAPRWYDGRLDADFQAPVLARLLFGDVPSMLAGTGAVDRAEVLERALEARWPDGRLGVGFAAGQRSGEPLTMLTGFSAANGCRIAVSVLSTNADRGVDDCASFTDAPGGALDATIDLGDLLCAGTDLRRSTAAVLSARFPYISPAGRFPSAGCHGTPHVAHVVDGGYQDASGAAVVEELWPAFEEALLRHPAVVASGACIVPVAVQLDSTEAPSPRSGDVPGEIITPLSTFLTAQRSIEAAARLGLMSAFSGTVSGPRTVADLADPFPGDPAGPGGGREPSRRFVRIAPQARPGATAPLGWTLSDAVRADLQDQLVVNRAQIEHLREVLDGAHLRCEARPSDAAAVTPAAVGTATPVPR